VDLIERVDHPGGVGDVFAGAGELFVDFVAENFAQVDDRGIDLRKGTQITPIRVVDYSCPRNHCAIASM
jgi:hypothetical protein